MSSQIVHLQIRTFLQVLLVMHDTFYEHCDAQVVATLVGVVIIDRIGRRAVLIEASIQARAVLCCAVLCCAVLCCAVLCCAVLCCAVLCCAVLCFCAHTCGNNMPDTFILVLIHNLAILVRTCAVAVSCLGIAL